MKSQTHFIRQKMLGKAIFEVKEVTSGWDNDLYLVNGLTAFRFPKTEKIAKKVEKEMKLLDQLKNQIDSALAVPDYTPHYGSNGTLRCVSYDFLHGTAFTGSKKEQTDENARLLGTFLSRLHSIDPLANWDAERGWQYWNRLYIELQENVLPRLPKDGRKAVEEVFHTFLTGFNEENNRTLVHGDLTPSNIVSNQGKVTAIIDFTDAHLGDAALDFAGFYWECGLDFTEKMLSFYEGENKEELLGRVKHFYGLQPVFHDLLHKVQQGIGVDWEKALDRFHELRK